MKLFLRHYLSLTDTNSGFGGTSNNFAQQNPGNSNFSGGNTRINSFGNFPPFPSSSSTCNSSAQLTGSQYNNQQQLPTSTPRFNSFENSNNNNNDHNVNKVLQHSYDTNFNATASYSKKDETSEKDDSDEADSNEETFDIATRDR